MSINKGILLKVGNLFENHGIKSIIRDDVVNEFSVSKKVFYQQNTYKEDLVEQILNMDNLDYKPIQVKIFGDEKGPIVRLILISDLSRSFLRGIGMAFDFYLKTYYPEIFKPIKEKYKQLLLHGTLVNIESGNTKGAYRKELDAYIIAKLHLARIKQISKNQTLSFDDFLSLEYSKEILLFQMNGLMYKIGETSCKKV